VENLNDNPIEPLLTFFSPDRLHSDSVPAAPNTAAMRAKLALQCPEVTQDAVHKWAQFMIDEGHMRPAKAVERQGVFVVATSKGSEAALYGRDEAPPAEQKKDEPTASTQPAKEEEKREKP